MHVCPVCGYPNLAEPPRSPSGGGSYEICPSCGFQFGVDDDDRGKTYEEARKAWKEAGSPWSSKGIPAPKGWNTKEQPATSNPAPRKVAQKHRSQPVRKAAEKAVKSPAKKVGKKVAKKGTSSRRKKPVQTAKKKPRNRR
ncbi:hypothetical protein DES53_107309 [Roseimicrobium gellanilyticum]|uniref:Uncharacterized protein n=1 Tax=Roseimicrobium gellanilyticum TaxID=748857 RepID=A0A366HHT0_9BACT|nr:hypothetical protein [Roseimicrobium gellanilyticum]RBP41476.1 hypothetical protein DES53_107309 [Roseimicrobium gellanilyticum]